MESFTATTLFASKRLEETNSGVVLNAAWDTIELKTRANSRANFFILKKNRGHFGQFNNRNIRVNVF